jgi:WD40 repeat protein
MQTAGFQVLDTCDPDLSTVAILGFEDDAAPAAGALGPDGRWAVTSGLSGPAKLWDVGSARALCTLDDTGPGWGVAFSPDESYVAAGMMDGRIRVFEFDARAGDVHPIATLAGRAPILSMSFDPTDPHRLVSASLDGCATLWDVGEAQQIGLAIANGGDSYRTIYHVRISGDGAYLAAACDDGVVRVWPMRNLAAKPVTLRGHKSTTWSVEFSPDSKRLASASADRTARIWSMDPALRAERVPTGTLSTHVHDRSVRVRLNADGRDSRSIRVDIPDGRSIELTAPPSFRQPVSAVLAPSTGRLAMVPGHGCPVIYDIERPDMPIAILDAPIQSWKDIGFAASLDRVIAVASSNEEYSWPLFRNRGQLLHFVEENLPRRAGRERAALSPELRCSLGLSAIDECTDLLSLSEDG